MSRTWMSHVTYEWVTHHMWISLSHMSESCHICMSHVAYNMIHVTYQKKIMDHSFHLWMIYITYEWGMPHLSEPCHIYMSHVTYTWVVSLTHTHRSWCPPVCMLQSGVNEACSHIWRSHVAHANASCHIWMSHVTHMNASRRTYECVMSLINEACVSHIWIRHVTCMNQSRHAHAHRS